MNGTVNIARSIFGHGFFADEPMTEREAWVWMIMEARWKPAQKRIGGVMVDLERGQLAASVRFMAGAWQWTAPRVQRFLKRLIGAKMICSKTDTGLTIITICNYEEFQVQIEGADTAAIQQRYKLEEGKKERRKKEEESKKELVVLANDLVRVGVEIYNETASRTGWPKVQMVSDKRKAALGQRLRECGGIEGWSAAMAKAAASDFLCGRSGSFRAGFDWLVTAGNFLKLMEGNYDNRGINQGPIQSGRSGQNVSLASIVARREVDRRLRGER